MSGLNFKLEEVAFGTVAVQVHSGGASPLAKNVKHEDPLMKLVSGTVNLRGERLLHVWDGDRNTFKIPMGGKANNAYLWAPSSESHAITTNEALWYSDII